jgi:hypothetical protein
VDPEQVAQLILVLLLYPQVAAVVHRVLIRDLADTFPVNARNEQAVGRARLGMMSVIKIK